MNLRSSFSPDLPSAAVGPRRRGSLYDVVLLGGRVIDPESGLDGVRTIGIRNGRIAAVTTRHIRGRETVEVLFSPSVTVGFYREILLRRDALPAFAPIWINQIVSGQGRAACRYYIGLNESY